MLMYHYKFLNDYLHKDCITNIFNGQIVLWEKLIGNDLFSISLCYPRYDMEGELSLAFNANYQELFIMSFAIIPGNVMHLSDEPIIFVTEVKGTRRQFELIRYSTRVLNDITPPVILATAVQAIATTLGIKSIAGITAQEQMTAGGEQDIGRWVPTYDELWISMGGRKLNEQAFYLAATPESKPITMVKISHRCRTKRKRQFKNDIYDDVIGTFREKCLRQGQTLQVTPE